MSFSVRTALSICEEISVKLFSTNITGMVLAPKIGLGFSCSLGWRRGIGNPHATTVQDIFGRFSKTETS